MFENLVAEPYKHRIANDKQNLIHAGNLNAITSSFYKELPNLNRIHTELDNPNLVSGDDVIKLADKLLDKELVTSLLEYEMNMYLRHPLYNTPVIAFHTGATSGWSVVNHPKLTAMIVVFEGVEFSSKVKSKQVDNSIVKFNAGDELIKVIKSEGLECKHWKTDPINDGTPINKNLSCKLVGSKTYVSGDSFITKGGVEAVSYEDVKNSTIILKLYSRIGRSNVIADFDKSSCKLKSVSAANPHSSRLQILANLMRLFKVHESFEFIEELTRHPDYYVRWNMMRELIALSPDNSLPILNRLASDDQNPQIRKLAKATIEYLSKREQQNAITI